MLSQRLTRINVKSLNNFFGSASRYCSGDNKVDARVEHKANRRTTATFRPGEWFSNLSVFQRPRGRNTDWLTVIQTDIDLRPSSIKRWWKITREEMSIQDERFIAERHKILGGDLAAAHFIVYRGGAVQFFGNSNWIRQDENEEYDLPKFNDPAYCIEAIDASKMKIHFEGLGNLMDLYRIKWLSLEGCPNIDDWCLDRISGAYRDSLEYLNVRNCPKVTARGLAALYRLSKLQHLIVSNDAGDQNVELASLMLEDIFPKLQIEGVTYLSMPDSTKNPEREDRESKKA